MLIKYNLYFKMSALSFVFTLYLAPNYEHVWDIP